MASKAHYAGTSANGQMPLFLPTSNWSAPELPVLRDKGFKRIAIDVETKDLELKTRGPGVRRGARIVGLAIGIEDTGYRYYFPVGHQGGGNLDEKLVRRWAKEELNDFSGEVCGTNLGYDLDFLAEWEITFPLVKALHDVQIAEPLIDEWRDEFKLEALARDYLGEGKNERLLEEAATAFGVAGRDAVKANIWRYPANLVGPYAEGDVDLPLRIFPLQEKKLKEEDLWEVYQVERKLIPMLVRMRRRGVRIDMDAAVKVRKKLADIRDRELCKLRELTSPTADFSLPNTFSRALESRGVYVPKTQKTGQPSITKPMLEENAGDELIDCIAKGRQMNTLINTFIDSQILGHSINGRVHPTFNQLKSDDGGTIARLSGSFPNTQFFPARDGELAPLIRGLFLPDEGDEWQANDLSQIQFRMLADCAVGQGAEEARAQYRDDPKTDFHKMTANMLGADPEDKVRRKRVKGTNFAKVFGAQVPKLAQTFGCSVEDATAFMTEYEAKLPFVSETFNAAARWANRRGYVVTVLNRRQRFPFWGPRGYKRFRPTPLFRSREEAHRYYVTEEHEYRGYAVRTVERVNTYMALNRKMQGSEGDLMKKWMVDAEAAGLTSEDALGPLLLTVHDELGSSVKPTARSNEAALELIRIGENAIKLKVPVLVGCVRGKTWGACL